VQRKRAGTRRGPDLIEKPDQLGGVQRLSVLVVAEVRVRVDDGRPSREQRPDLVNDGLEGRSDVHAGILAGSALEAGQHRQHATIAPLPPWADDEAVLADVAELRYRHGT
jgi:hypothetical protein